ncbi:MAG: 3D domain-containing protein [Candidatus Woesearchaeota archaeon]
MMKRLWMEVIVPWLLILAVIGLLISGVLHHIDGIVKKHVEEIRIGNNVIVNETVDGKNVNYMYGIATAYTPNMKGINSDSNPSVTSIGMEAKNGIIAVNPKVIPYGSQVMIIHDKTVIRGIAGDTGGAMRQNPAQVDILMENHKNALKWGKKDVHIIWWSK